MTELLVRGAQAVRMGELVLCDLTDDVDVRRDAVAPRLEAALPS